jgi:hypothetical protein
MSAPINAASRAERTVLMKHGLERVTADQFHPEADATVDLVRAEDRDDVGVLDSGEQAPLVDRAGRRLVVRRRIPVEKLDLHFAFEARIPGAVDGAELTGADAAPDLQAAPTPKSQYRWIVDRRSIGVDCLRAMHLTDASQAPQLRDQLAVSSAKRLVAVAQSMALPSATASARLSRRPDHRHAASPPRASRGSTPAMRAAPATASQASPPLPQLSPSETRDDGLAILVAQRKQRLHSVRCLPR